MKRLILIAFWIFLIIRTIAPMALGDNLITNGSFTTFGSAPPTFTSGTATLAAGGTLTSQTNNTAVVGWSFFAGAIVVGGSTTDSINQASSSSAAIPNPPSGQTLDIQLAATGGLLTSTSVTATTTAAIQVTAGRSYDLRFFINSQSNLSSATTGTIAISGVANGSIGAAAIGVTSSTISAVGGTRPGASTSNNGNTVTMNSGTIPIPSKSQAWDQVDVIFRATASGNIQLVFAGTAVGNGLALSNVTLSTLAPENTSLAVICGFLVGCVGTEVYRRRRRRSISKAQAVAQWGRGSLEPS